MENITEVISPLDGSEHIIIDRGNGEFTSMSKEVYEAQQVEHLTSPLTDPTA